MALTRNLPQYQHDWFIDISGFIALDFFRLKSYNRRKTVNVYPIVDIVALSEYSL